MNYRNIIIVIMAVVLVACGGQEERKASYLAKVQDYLKAGNYPKARVALRNVLKIDPKDADTYFLFAQVEEKEKDWRNAVVLYQEVIELAPTHSAALIKLAKYYLEAHLSNYVIETADKVLAIDPRNPQAGALKIAALAMEGSLPEATLKVEALAKEFPTEPDVAILRATLYGQQQRTSDAVMVLRQALEAHPKDMDLLNNLNSILLQGKDFAGAVTVARRMIDMEPTVFDHRLRLAQIYDKQRAPDKAETVLRDAIGLDPQSEERRLLLADFLQTRKSSRAANQVFLDAVSDLPHSTKLRMGLAEFYFKNGQEPQAREQYHALVKEYQDKAAGLNAMVKLAELDLYAGKQADANRRIQEVLKINPRSTEALVLSGRMTLAKRNGKDAVQAFRTVLHDQPELATVHFLLGQAYQVTGEINLAKESLEQAIALYPGQVDAHRALVGLEAQSGRPQQARARLDDLLKQRPDDLVALDMLMNLDLVTKNWTQAAHTLERLKSISKDSVVVSMAEGRLREAQGQLDQAAQAYERATVLAPNEPEPLLSLLKVEIAQTHTDQTKARLEALVAAQPDHLFGHGLLGEVLAMTGHPKEADSQFKEATMVNPKWITPWLDWGNLWLAQKLPDQAVQVIQAGLTVNQDSEELYMLLALAHTVNGRVDSAIAAYDGALRLNPRNLLAANNLAVMLVDSKGDPQNLQKAFALIRDFEKDAPHPLFLDTLGWVRFKMGQQEEALRIMRGAVAKAPDVPTLNYHLGIAYFQTGKTAEARTHLAKALKSTESFQGRQEAEQILSQRKG